MKEAINNLELILPLLEFKEEGDFYTVNIYLRKKDKNTDKSNTQSVRCIKTYVVYSKEYLHKRYEEIKQLCELFGARAYISLNSANNKDIALKMIEKLVHCLQNKNHKVEGVYNSVVGSLSSKERIWILDIDSEYMNRLEDIKAKLDDFRPEGNKLLQQIPSKSGIHLITKRFDSEALENWCKENQLEVQINKHNPTNLYIPSSLINQI